MIIFRLDFWQEPLGKYPLRRYEPSAHDQPAATERADQLRAKGVFTVGPYVVEVAA